MKYIGRAVFGLDFSIEMYEKMVADPQSKEELEDARGKLKELYEIKRRQDISLVDASAKDAKLGCDGNDPDDSG